MIKRLNLIGHALRFVLAFSFFAAPTAFAESGSAKRLSEDFFVSVATKNWKPFARTPLRAELTAREICEIQLRAAVCETSASRDQITSNFERTECLASSSQFVPALMEIYDETPEKMRASLCSLDHIYISDEIESTAFASAITDPFGHFIGGLVGFRKGTFLQQPSAHALVTWKEQLAFGGSGQFLANDPSLVQIFYNLQMDHLKEDGLFYVLMHELGHLIDFNNGVNSRFGLTDWSRLSWQSVRQPLEESKFAYQDEFCFYDCSSYLSASQATEIYSSLGRSAFITTYAGMNAYEDFAEFWAWHQMIAVKNPNFSVVIPNGPTLDMNLGFTSNPKIKAKLDFIDQLWNSPTLKIANHK